MNLFERAHFLHRAWRYRLRTEREELSFVFRSDLRGGTVLDIGANRGIYSYWMHQRVGPQGQVIAFEPQPELCACLHELKADFKLDRLTIVPSALSSTSGQRQLVRPTNHWGGASLDSALSPGSEALTITGTTLDEYFNDHPSRPVGFIKCDIEGHELACFRGGEALLRQDHPTVLFECGDESFAATSDYLQGLGYAGHFLHLRQLYPLAVLPQFRARLRPRYLNYVFQAASKARLSGGDRSVARVA